MHTNTERVRVPAPHAAIVRRVEDMTSLLVIAAAFAAVSLADDMARINAPRGD